MRWLLRWCWVGFLKASGSLWWAKRQLRRRGAIVVLMLHRVLDEFDWGYTNSLNGMVLRQRTFEKLAAYLARLCEPLSLDEAAPGTAGEKIKIVITFDDGWRDNFTTALPIARAHGLPLTVFLCTGLMERTAPFWPERVMAALRAMRSSVHQAEAEVLISHLKKYTPQERAEWLENLSQTMGTEDVGGEPFEGDSTLQWEEIAEMDRAGVVFGSHTHTHQIVTTLTPDGLRREIRESRATIERHLGKCDGLFAYPNGNWSGEARRILAEEGFRLAFTTERNAWTEECDPLLIPRTNVCENNVTGLRGSFSRAMFEYTTFWKVWRAMRAKARLAVLTSRRSARAAA
jgi:peptidoglycan/xylan/chitin deacetylase (PgdA/CDA1 family)